MFRLAATIAAVLAVNAVSFLNAQTSTSGNITATVSAPASIECSAPFGSSLTLTGFDVQDPGVADIVFVLDESGSINSASFSQMKTFVRDLAAALMTGPGGARVGVAMFANTARTILPLTDNEPTAVAAINGITQALGATCIGCGILEGREIFDLAPPRPAATKFMIVLTDGANTVNTSTFPTVVNQAKAAGITMLAIGVGSSINTAEINFIASDIVGVQTAFFTPSFTQLTTIVTSLTAAITSPGATNVTVNLSVMPRFPLVGTPTATGGAVTVLGSSVEWTLPSLGSAPRTLTLNHQHDGNGNGPLQIFSATYTDAQGHIVEIPDLFTSVSGCNVAPVANAGIDQFVSLSGSDTFSVTLDGSGSTDDGLLSPLTYSWASDHGGHTASGVSPTLQLPFGAYVFTLTVSDGEFSDTDEVIIAVDDPSPPVITSTVSGTLGNNGWYRSNVDVTFAVSDPETGISSSSGCDPSIVSIDTTGDVFTCTATNGAGVSASASETVKRDVTAPTLTVSGPVTAEATSSSGATVTYPAPVADDLTSGLAGAAVCAPASGSLFPLGATTVSCDAVDNAGNPAAASFTVTVGDTTPPTIGDVSPSTSSLSPPNHKMVSITIAASATDGVSAASCQITGASSNEPDNGLGDGDTANDIVITGPLSLQLRAERSGGGSGRTYTIEVTCTDAAGNAAVQSTTVSVPH